jgi:predicted nucleic acid-binding Zn ribbon protein
MLIDLAIPRDRNVTQKECQKIFKYKERKILIQRTWKVKTRVLPVIIGEIRMSHAGVS